MSRFLDRESYDTYNEYYKIRHGSSDSTEYEKTALKIIREKLPTPISRLYLEKYDQTKKKERITKICEEVIDAYRKMLSEEDWLSDETKQKAIEKLNAIKTHAVYPDKWEDFSSLNLNGLSLYDQITEITEFKQSLDRTQTNGKVDPDIWDLDFDILYANAFLWTVL